MYELTRFFELAALVQQNFMFCIFAIKCNSYVCIENEVMHYIFKIKCEQLVEKKFNLPIIKREEEREKN